jgi:hypothetical protein
LTLAAVPPTEEQIRTGRPLSYHQGVTCAIRYIGKADVRIQVQNAVGIVYAFPLNADIARGGDEQTMTDLGIADAAVGRTAENANDCREADVRRVMRELGILRKGTNCRIPESLLFQER